MQTMFDSGAGRLLGELRQARDAFAARPTEPVQWRAGVRDWQLHWCCRCSCPIWPGAKHHRILIGERERRIHYARCPHDPDPFPEYGPADRGAAAFEWALAAVGVAFALAVLVALSMALGYEW